MKGDPGLACRFRLLREGSDRWKESPGTALLMLIDGNRNDNTVLFDHDGHAERPGGDSSCGTCHHLNQPLDHNTPCSGCHRDMFAPTRVFDHDLHIGKLGKNRSCHRCHPDPAAGKGIESSRACVDCHFEDAPEKPLEFTKVCLEGHEETEVSKVLFRMRPRGDRWNDAPSYTDAMHGLCVGCHVQITEGLPKSKPVNLARFDTCHDADRGPILRGMIRERTVEAIPRDEP